MEGLRRVARFSTGETCIRNSLNEDAKPLPLLLYLKILAESFISIFISFKTLNTNDLGLFVDEQ